MAAQHHFCKEQRAQNHRIIEYAELEGTQDHQVLALYSTIQEAQHVPKTVPSTQSEAPHCRAEWDKTSIALLVILCLMSPGQGWSSWVPGHC